MPARAEPSCARRQPARRSRRDAQCTVGPAGDGANECLRDHRKCLMNSATNQAARVLEVCINEAAIKCSQIAARSGVFVNETQVLLMVQQDPEGETAKAFQALFLAALKGAREAMAA